MTKQKIIEGNEIIAAFIGNIPTSINKRWFVSSYGEMKYHSSWDWLMPVVEKMQHLNYHVLFSAFYDDDINKLSGEYWCVVKELSKGTTTDDAIVDMTGCYSQIEAVWKAVVEFIKWYNNGNNN